MPQEYAPFNINFAAKRAALAFLLPDVQRNRFLGYAASTSTILAFPCAGLGMTGGRDMAATLPSRDMARFKPVLSYFAIVSH